MLSDGCNMLQFQRIHGGTAATPGTFKFVPLIYSFFTIKQNGRISRPGKTCTSTIISKRHILTAAHCVLMPRLEADHHTQR